LFRAGPATWTSIGAGRPKFRIWQGGRQCAAQGLNVALGRAVFGLQRDQNLAIGLADVAGAAVGEVDEDRLADVV